MSTLVWNALPVLSALAAAFVAPAIASAQIPHAPAAASPPEDGNWTMPARDFASTRYSGLDEINTSNVKSLAVAHTFSTGTLKGQESAVLAVNGMMYFVTSFPNYLIAIDLSKPGGELKWKYDPKADPAAQGVACCQAVNRGPLYAGGSLYDYTGGEAMTMAPLVVKDKVLVGNSGAEFGARGWLVALNTRDGSQAWRAYSTGPDSDVLIDPAEFKPFYPQYRGKDLGVREWPP